MNELLPKRTYPSKKNMYTTFTREFCPIKSIVRDNTVDQRISIPLQRDVYTGEPKLQITESSQKTIS